jgi:hypothetical protein
VRTFLIAAMLPLMAATGLSVSESFGFDYGRYQAADLDDIIAQKRPATGADVFRALPYRMTVTLSSYAEPCNATFLKRSMIMVAIPKAQVDATPITRCIKVRSAKGKVQSVFIQDKVAEFLPREVPLGSKLMLFAIHLYTDPDGPGLLINEFSTGDTVPATPVDPA